VSGSAGVAARVSGAGKRRMEEVTDGLLACVADCCFPATTSDGVPSEQQLRFPNCIYGMISRSRRR